MTIEEKQKAIKDHCERMESCRDCPLNIIGVACYEDMSVVGHNYDILFPDSQPTNDAVDHPGHYNREGAMECIKEMVLIFGVEATMSFCKLNAWKYRYRAADKNGLEDLKKSDWYIRMYEKLNGGEEL